MCQRASEPGSARASHREDEDPAQHEVDEKARCGLQGKHSGDELESIHEDLERLEQAISDRIAEDPRNVSQWIFRSQLLQLNISLSMTSRSKTG